MQYAEHDKSDCSLIFTLILEIKSVDKKDRHRMQLSPKARNMSPKMNYKIRPNKCIKMTCSFVNCKEHQRGNVAKKR